MCVNTTPCAARSALLMLCCASAPAWSAGYLGMEGAFSRGDFGTGNTATLYGLHLSGGIVEPDYDAGILVPFVHIRDEEDYSETGFGDVLLHGGLGLLRTEDWTADVTLSIKAPTADEAESLGTGEKDLGIFVDAGKHWYNTMANIGLGYINIGDPADVEYDNVLTWNLGVFTRFGRWGLQTALRGQTSMFAEGDDPWDLYFGGFHAFTADYAATVNAAIGLSDGAPDFTGALGLVRWF